MLKYETKVNIPDFIRIKIVFKMSFGRLHENLLANLTSAKIATKW